MKATIAYYFLMLYATVMFKPLVPVIRDAISHEFSEAMHIATVHAIYGSNHLQKELSETENENPANKDQNGNIHEESQVPVHIPEGACTFYIYSCTGIAYTHMKLSRPASGFVATFSLPPKFC